MDAGSPKKNGASGYQNWTYPITPIAEIGPLLQMSDPPRQTFG
jgi:hypothetical protein